MPVTLSQIEDAVLTVLRTFLLGVLPLGIEVVRGQNNRTPEPLGPDFIVMTPTLRGRLSTNVSTYQQTAGTRRVLAPTQLTIQLDVHGPNGADNAQVVSTLLRDFAACTAFKAAGIDAVPLYAGDPRQIPFINGEAQFEDRWIVDAVLQVNPAATVPQDFAAKLRTDTRTADQGSATHGGTIIVPADGAARGTTSPPPSVTASYAETVIADGIRSIFTVTHGLGTTDVIVDVRDPSDSNARIPGVDDLAPTPDTVTVVFGSPPPRDMPLRIIVIPRR
jgi:hypothetical protein